MRRSLTYVDAVRILGGGENKIIKVLDDTSAGGLLTLGIFDLFEARQELIRLGTKLVKNLGERLRGLNRATRTERLYAAHAVVLITAYFEALDAAVAKLGLEDRLELSAADRVSLATGSRARAGWSHIIELLLSEINAELMSPFSIEFPGSYYQFLHAATLRYIRGLAPWDALDETARDRLMNSSQTLIIQPALTRYQEHLRQLAVDCPEFGIWLGLQAHEQTRREVRHGLSGLAALLDSIQHGNLLKAHSDLSRSYLAALDRPITGEADPELTVPTLAEGYIDHRFRTSYKNSTARPADESWWQTRPIRDDLDSFLAGYLISAEAHTAPLLVLGQPGSGKSVLTRILAARLPAQGFLPVRVELRNVPADDTIQAQIETAVSLATGKTVNWTELVESAPDALPVILLDGFDELLQATGVSQTNFLKRVAEFQRREAVQERPVAVIVTSRTAVADRATIPVDSGVLNLEPFDDAQTMAWLTVWNRCNAPTALPLSAATVLAYRELAQQPLLLLMLALYNASTGQLSDSPVKLDSVEIYEQLLREFARRELLKDQDETDLSQRVERELVRLSAVAFAMFNRGAQWVDEPGLTADLAALKIESPHATTPHTLRAPLTSGQIVVGRFFFVHNSRATRDGQQLQTYEFLHATFSEYLVARLVMRLLEDVARREAPTTFAVPTAIDDGILHALLSFECLAIRAPIVEFLRTLISRQPPELRAAMAGILLRLHHIALDARTDARYADYAPAPANVVERCAAWSANLVLLAVLTAGEITGRQLFEDHLVVKNWRGRAMMWRGQLSSEGWSGLVTSVALVRDRIDDWRDIRLTVADSSFEPATPDLIWTLDSGFPEGSTIRLGTPAGIPLLKSNFTVSKSEDLMTHDLTPFRDTFPTIRDRLYLMEDGRWISAAHALLGALIQPNRDADTAFDDLITVIRAIGRQGPSYYEEERYWGTAFSVFLSVAEQGEHSPSLLTKLTGLIQESDEMGFARWAGLSDRFLALLPTPDLASPTPPTPPESEASQPPSPSPATSSPETPARRPAAP